MKRIIIWSLLLGLLATSCQKTAIITVKLSPDVDVKTVTIIHSQPVNGVCFKSFSDTLYFDDNREASVTISNSAPSQVYFYNAKNFKAFSLLVEKGNDYQIAYSDSAAFKIIDSPNNKAQELLNKFSFPGFISQEAMPFYEYKDEKALRAKLDSLYKKAIDPFSVMLNKKEISSEFYAFIEKDRNCYYSAIMGTVVSLFRYY